eukprot:m.70140 g.70140  ORF g.70140 m.70140 type:complete len:263 (+) comp24182_c0_seq1:152-940(+)
MIQVHWRTLLQTLVVFCAARTSMASQGYNNSWMDTATLIHVPKTGGTSIETWGRAHDRFYGAAIFKYNKHPHPPWSNLTRFKYCDWAVWNSTCCSWWHLPPKYFSDFDGSIKTLAVVRDPVLRAISQVKYRLKWQAKHWAHNAWCKNETFDNYIISRLKAYAQDPYVEDCHWIPQKEYVTMNDGSLVDNMILIDTSKLSPMMAMFSSAIEAVHTNVSPRCDNVVLNATTINMIHEVYEGDYEIAKLYKMSAVHHARHDKIFR